ncbi:MAG: LLM class flavin-dependent oxidoreductase [Sphingomonadaceae bacterium]|nr:LLM class flavin-dependent oxidoreductase [Sphingomonadaceae bacterium]
MRFGITVPKIYDPSSRDPYAKTFELCQMAEDLGYDFCSVGHHSFTPDGGTESAPFVFLAALATRTSTIRLVTGIYLLPLHHPAAVAEQLATLDVISNGRAVMGVGVGYRDYEFDAFGVDIHQRGARMNEAMTAIRSAFTEGRWNHAGKFWTLKDLPLQPTPIQNNGPPMWVGGSSDAAIKRAATLGDGWMSDNMINIDGEAERADFYRNACKAAGREVGEVCILRTAWISATRKEAEDAVMPSMRAYLAHYTGANAGSGTLPWESDLMQRIARQEHVPVEEFTRGQALAGTPDDVIAELEGWRDKVRPDSIELMITGPGDYDSLKRMISLFGKDVLPQFS